ncbi:hypothetical protein F5141DRAFT_1202913 [Pisolithus sp. B1]|nr:hypothetical protein F5141DRAFT_1202913 [Pisolithus sp. B1]
MAIMYYGREASVPTVSGPGTTYIEMKKSRHEVGKTLEVWTTNTPNRFATGLAWCIRIRLLSDDVQLWGVVAFSGAVRDFSVCEIQVSNREVKSARKAGGPRKPESMEVDLNRNVSWGTSTKVFSSVTAYEAATTESTQCYRDFCMEVNELAKSTVSDHQTFSEGSGMNPLCGSVPVGMPNVYVWPPARDMHKYVEIPKRGWRE